MSRVVLAYSGGLDTSVLLKKLILEGHEVVAMTVDLGESDARRRAPARAAALEAVRAKAIALGAYDAVLIDARERFIDGVRVCRRCAPTRSTKASIRSRPRSRVR